MVFRIQRRFRADGQNGTIFPVTEIIRVGHGNVPFFAEPVKPFK